MFQEFVSKRVADYVTAMEIVNVINNHNNDIKNRKYEN